MCGEVSKFQTKETDPPKKSLWLMFMLLADMTTLSLASVYNSIHLIPELLFLFRIWMLNKWKHLFFFGAFFSLYFKEILIYDKVKNVKETSWPVLWIRIRRIRIFLPPGSGSLQKI